MTLPLAVSFTTIVIVFLVVDTAAFLLWVGLREQRRREAAGGKDPDEPLPEPAPERRE
jgi:hypothetical protein